jgi:hypothetical protein
MEIKFFILIYKITKLIFFAFSNEKIIKLKI